jgi:hypothetical protein
VKFFFDNCVSKYLAQIIVVLEGSSSSHVIKTLGERFAPNTPDSEWLTVLSSEKEWIVITADERLRRGGGIEKAVWKSSNVVTFFLAKNWVNHDKFDQAWRFLRWWPYIVKQSALARPGSAFEVSENFNGKFKSL